MRTGTAVLAGSPRKVAAANDRGGLRTADVVNDSCVASFVCLSPKGAAFATAFRANIVDVAAVVEAPEAPVASGAPDVIDAPEVPDAELFEPMVPGAAPLRDAAGAAGLATAAIVRGGATAASGLPHTLRLGAVTDMAAAAAAGGAAALVAWAPVRLLDILYTQGSQVVLKVLTSDCRPGTSVWLGRTPQQESTCLTPRSGPELSLLVYFIILYVFTPISLMSSGRKRLLSRDESGPPLSLRSGPGTNCSSKRPLSLKTQRTTTLQPSKGPRYQWRPVS